MNEVNNDFKVIYKILSSLEKGLDYEEFNSECIYKIVEQDVSRQKYNKLLLMLYDKGYIKGTLWETLESRERNNINNLEITLEGLEYLKENSKMKK